MFSKIILVVVALATSFFCLGQETAVEKAYWTFKYADNLEKALKNPAAARGVYILNYTDSVFPNEDIAKLVNVEQIVIRGKDRLRKKKKDVASAPVRIRIDVERLQKLSKLKYLSLSYFEMREFPVELCQLNSLELLELSSCFLDSVPGEISNLSNLKLLALRLNHLTSLPSSIAQLDSLEFLDLGNNRFTTLPGELVMMKSLRKVSLANPDSPDSLAEKHWKWPHPIHVNRIDYLAEYSKLHSLVTKPNIQKVYVATDSRTTAQKVTTQMNSLELSQKVLWRYFPPAKASK